MRGGLRRPVPEEQVLKIRALRELGKGITFIANFLGIKLNTARVIVRNETRLHLQPDKQLIEKVKQELISAGKYEE